MGENRKFILLEKNNADLHSYSDLCAYMVLNILWLKSPFPCSSDKTLSQVSENYIKQYHKSRVFVPIKLGSIPVLLPQNDLHLSTS